MTHQLPLYTAPRHPDAPRTTDDCPPIGERCDALGCKHHLLISGFGAPRDGNPRDRRIKFHPASDLHDGPAPGMLDVHRATVDDLHAAIDRLPYTCDRELDGDDAMQGDIARFAGIGTCRQRVAQVEETALRKMGKSRVLREYWRE